MKPVYQTTFGENGNCYSACIASLLELPIESVPNWSKNPYWHWLAADFCRMHGWKLFDLEYSETANPKGWHIVNIESPRNPEWLHAVLRNGDTGEVFDPYGPNTPPIVKQLRVQRLRPLPDSFTRKYKIELPYLPGCFPHR